MSRTLEKLGQHALIFQYDNINLSALSYRLSALENISGNMNRAIKVEQVATALEFTFANVKEWNVFRKDAAHFLAQPCDGLHQYRFSDNLPWADLGTFMDACVMATGRGYKGTRFVDRDIEERVIETALIPSDRGVLHDYSAFVQHVSDLSFVRGVRKIMENGDLNKLANSMYDAGYTINDRDRVCTDCDNVFFLGADS